MQDSRLGSEVGTKTLLSLQQRGLLSLRRSLQSHPAQLSRLRLFVGAIRQPLDFLCQTSQFPQADNPLPTITLMGPSYQHQTGLQTHKRQAHLDGLRATNCHLCHNHRHSHHLPVQISREALTGKVDSLRMALALQHHRQQAIISPNLNIRQPIFRPRAFQSHVTHPTNPSEVSTPYLFLPLQRRYTIRRRIWVTIRCTISHSANRVSAGAAPSPTCIQTDGLKRHPTNHSFFLNQRTTPYLSKAPSRGFDEVLITDQLSFLPQPL